MTAVRSQSDPRDGLQKRQRCNCSLPNPGGSSQSSGGGADEQFPSDSSKYLPCTVTKLYAIPLPPSHNGGQMYRRGKTRRPGWARDRENRVHGLRNPSVSPETTRGAEIPVLTARQVKRKELVSARNHRSRRGSSLGGFCFYSDLVSSFHVFFRTQLLHTDYLHLNKLK